MSLRTSDPRLTWDLQHSASSHPKHRLHNRAGHALLPMRGTSKPFQRCRVLRRYRVSNSFDFKYDTSADWHPSSTTMPRLNIHEHDTLMFLFFCPPETECSINRIAERDVRGIRSRLPLGIQSRLVHLSRYILGRHPRLLTITAKSGMK